VLGFAEDAKVVVVAVLTVCVMPVDVEAL